MADDSAAEIVALGTAAVAAAVGLGKLNGGITNVVNTFVSSAFSMSKSATGGAASLADMGAAVGQVAGLLPGLGAAFSTVLNTAIATLEKNITTQQALSNVGATFGGQLGLLRDTANKTFLSLDDFAKVVGANSSVLTTFQGGVQAGTEAFARTQRILLTSGTETSNMMSNLGIGFQEAADMTALFMRGQGAMNKARQMSETEIAQATANYALELTALSNLTGQSRKVLAEKVSEEMAEAQFQSYLASLDPDEAKKLQAAVTQELAVTGKAGADALKAQAAGFPPMTAASKLFTATQETSVARQQELIEISKNANISYDEAQKRFSKSLADSIPGMREDFNKIRTVLLAGGLQGGTDLSKAVEQIVRTLTATTNKTPAEIKQITDDLTTAARTAGSSAVVGADQMKAMIDAANASLKAMQPTLDSTIKAGVGISKWLNEQVAKPIADGLPKIIDKTQKTLEELYNKLNLSQVTKDLFDPNKLGEKITKLINESLGMAGTAIKAAGGDKAAQEQLYNDMLEIWNKAVILIQNSMTSFFSGSFLDRIIGSTTPSSGPPGTVGNTEGSGGIVRQILNSIDEKVFGPPPAPPRSEVPEGPAPRPRADGGPVRSGQTYLVGERGPELLNVGAQGDVISNDKLTTMLSAVSNQNGMKESVDQLNNTNSQMLAAIRDLIDVSKRTLTATKGLNGNLFAA